MVYFKDKTHQKIFSLAIIFLTLIDLYVFAFSYITYIPRGSITRKPAIIEDIRDLGNLKVFNMYQYFSNLYAKFGWRDFNIISSIHQAMLPNNNTIYDIAEFTDRGWFEGGLSLKRRNELEIFFLRFGLMEYYSRILGLYSVKYIISPIGISRGQITKVKDYDLGEGVKLSFFENKDVKPRVYFVPQAIYAKNDDEFFSKLSNLEFSFDRYVILEEPITNSEFNSNVDLDLFNSRNHLEIFSEENDQIIIKTELKDFGYLVLNDSYYPGWVAEVDGKPQKILVANYLVRALRLEPGVHDVRMYYSPFSFKLGLTVSITSLVICLVLIFNKDLIRTKGKKYTKM